MAAMQDLQRVEELSSTAALGMWADDVILALDRVTRLNERNSTDLELLEEAAVILEVAARQSESTVAESGSAGSIAASETALDMAEALAPGGEGHDAEKLLAAVVDLLRKAHAGALGDDPHTQLGPAINFFAALSRQQLVASNSVLAPRQDAEAWTGLPTTSNSF